MKPLLPIILICFLFTSCASMFWPNEKKYEDVYSNMSVQDFKEAHPKAINERITQSTSVYSITYYDTEKKVVNRLGDAKYKKFYYFRDGKLIQVDRGERAVDYRVQVD